MAKIKYIPDLTLRPMGCMWVMVHGRLGRVEQRLGVLRPLDHAQVDPEAMLRNQKLGVNLPNSDDSAPTLSCLLSRYSIVSLASYNFRRLLINMTFVPADPNLSKCLLERSLSRAHVKPCYLYPFLLTAYIALLYCSLSY